MKPKQSHKADERISERNFPANGGVLAWYTLPRCPQDLGEAEGTLSAQYLTQYFEGCDLAWKTALDVLKRRH